MTTTTTIKTIFNCPLERAFKTPMLCDVAKVHTGFLIMPRVTHTTGDENWGKPGYSKKIFVSRMLIYPGGEASTDTVVERIENKYWKIEIGNIKAPMPGFTKLVGEWSTTELEPNKILITYTYTMYTGVVWLYPFNWLITKTFWRIYMRQVLANVRHMAYNNEPYLYH